MLGNQIVFCFPNNVQKISKQIGGRRLVYDRFDILLWYYILHYGVRGKEGKKKKKKID